VPFWDGEGARETAIRTVVFTVRDSGYNDPSKGPKDFLFAYNMWPVYTMVLSRVPNFRVTW